VTALLSSTTMTGRKRNRAHSLSRAVIVESTIEPTIVEPTIEPTIEPTLAEATMEPTIESSRARIAAKTKSLTLPESRLWHRRLAHMNPTIMKSLVREYTHDDSMWTVCIEA
jgi:hypothetical protein